MPSFHTSRHAATEDGASRRRSPRLLETPGRAGCRSDHWSKASVTAPRLALDASLANFARTPRV
jgi:hypothetical protein